MEDKIIGLGFTGVDFYTTSNISGSVTKTGPKSFTFTKS